MTHVSFLVAGNLTARAAALYPHGEDWLHTRRFVHEQDRARALLAAHYLRLAAAHLLNVGTHEVSLLHNCRTCDRDGDHGRPVVRNGPARGVHLSATHAGDVVVVAASRSSLVGVDVEAIEHANFSGFDAAALTAREQAALTGLESDRATQARALLWTRKEAVLKATGFGLAIDPRSLEIDETGRVVTTDPRLIAEGVDVLRVWDLQGLPDGHVGSVAAAAEQVARLARPQLSTAQRVRGC